jgi:hypothetical protein
MSDWRTVVHYRNRAEMLLTIANELESDDHRLALRKAAAHLDKLAVALERETRAENAHHA